MASLDALSMQAHTNLQGEIMSESIQSSTDESTENFVVLTPYAAHTLVNAVLVQRGIKPIPSQMMYNYTSGKTNVNKKPLIKYDALTNNVDREDLERWLKAYIVKKEQGVVVHAPLNI